MVAVEELAREFAEFIMEESGDGLGVFIFGADIEYGNWRFSKVAGMVDPIDEISRLHKSLSLTMNDGQPHILSIACLPLAEDGSWDKEGCEMRSYMIYETNIKPIGEEEARELGVILWRHDVKMVKATEWHYSGS